MHSASGSYTGNGTSQDIALAFDPVVVIICASGAAQPPIIMLSSCPTPGTSYDLCNEGNAYTNAITLGSGKFSVGSSAYANTNGRTYYYIALAADPSCLYVGSYAGDNSNGRTISCGFQPDFILTMCPGLGDSPVVWFGTKGGANDLRTGYGTTWQDLGIEGVNSSGFVVNYNFPYENVSGHTYYFFVLKNTTGNVLQSSYTGDGNNNRNIVQSDAFPPLCAIIHADGAGYFYEHPSSLSGDETFTWNSVCTENSGYIEALNSNGFEVGSSGGPAVNTNGTVYHFLSLGNPVWLTVDLPVEMLAGASKVADLPVEMLGTLQRSDDLPAEALGSVQKSDDLPVEWLGLWLAVCDTLDVLALFFQSFLDVLTIAAEPLASFTDTLDVQEGIGAGSFTDSLTVLPVALVAGFNSNVQCPYAEVSRG